jgi:hypothetical protein
MWRLVAYPCFFVAWLWAVARGHCRPFCTEYDRLPNADGRTFPIRMKCRRCGRAFEV